jgi:hypothetical protein
MLVSQTMMRSSFKPSQPKPQAGPRKRKCKVCRELFQPRNMMHKACGPECAVALANQERLVKERKADRERKQALKTRRDWMADAQRAFNAFIRERDKDKPCISCGKPPPDMTQLHAGRDAGHYRSVGSAPHMRFIEDNCHAQCVKCNQYGSGMAVDYRISLTRRIGLERVEAVETDQTLRKFTVEELKAITKIYRAKLKALKEAQSCQMD